MSVARSFLTVVVIKSCLDNISADNGVCQYQMDCHLYRNPGGLDEASSLAALVNERVLTVLHSLPTDLKPLEQAGHASGFVYTR